ncbi:Uncharacterised protein [Citrobacter freundii]|nr:Uncharacterised protein [Citrobacter freundii]
MVPILSSSVYVQACIATSISDNGYGYCIAIASSGMIDNADRFDKIDL